MGHEIGHHLRHVLHIGHQIGQHLHIAHHLAHRLPINPVLRIRLTLDVTNTKTIASAAGRHCTTDTSVVD